MPVQSGPTGVMPEHRGKGAGQALRVKCLQGLVDEGVRLDDSALRLCGVCR